MHRYYFRTYTGPTTVQAIAERLRAQAMPWQRVTIEGTEHVHYAIDALHADAARREINQWFTRAALPIGPSCYTFESLRREDI